LAIHQYSRNAAIARAIPPTRAGTATATGKAFFAAAEGVGVDEAVITWVTTDCRLAMFGVVGVVPGMVYRCHGAMKIESWRARIEVGFRDLSATGQLQGETDRPDEGSGESAARTRTSRTAGWRKVV